MTFTDIFIKRPVLATVISLLILIFGLRAIYDLPVRQYPEVENTVITVTTAYPGASAGLIQGFITTPIQKSVASADGIDYLTSSSSQGVSTIEAHIKLNFDPDKAFTGIMSKVAAVSSQLPKAAEDPVIEKSTGSTVALMYISFSSDKMSPGQITDYISRVVQPKLETVGGVAEAQILGGNTFSMRIWLNPIKMAAFDVTPADVVNALQNNNFQSAAGTTKGEYVAFNINASTGLQNAKDFGNLIVKTSSTGAIVRLRDVSKVELGAQNYDSSVTFNGKKAVFIGITATPSANPLTVITQVRKELPGIEKQFPPSLKAKVVYDATDYIRASIYEVIQTIVEATIIVILVIFLFLGSIRSVIIPVVTIPLSLIGVCSLMLGLGYSLNLLTLLSMVLAIGLVVDDAIVVVENIHRHIEAGLTAFNAAIKGAREIFTPIVAMTITLAAVYAPIGFMGGLTGALFTEFAFTLASAVIISGIIALTLSPMMCSKVLNSQMSQQRFVRFVDKTFNNLKQRYERRVHNTLTYKPVVLVFAAIVLSSCFFLYINTQSELAPEEDQSALFISATAPKYANIDYVEHFTEQFDKIFESFPATKDYFIVNGMGAVNNVIAGMILKPWDQRSMSQQALNKPVQNDLHQIAGLKAVAFPLPSLPVGNNGLPVQFVITSTSGYPLIFQYMQKIQDAAMKSGMFMFVDSSLKFNNPQVEVNINRNKAADLGLNMQDIGQALAINYGGNYINYFDMDGRSYEVIPQALRKFRYNPGMINNIYLRSATGQLFPLSTIVSLKQTVQPNALTQFQQLNSATLQGMVMPGRTLGEALTYLQNQAQKILPKDFGYDYSGQSRQYVEEGSALVVVFFFSIIVIFLVLAAQFESFRDPLIIIITVPMAICGALIPLNLGLATINIYTQVGLITLIGLISKHGILMVDFANKLQINEGLSKREAIERSAGIRLRPILMTTFAMVLGVMPLLIATGAGAVSRFDIGLVIATGMSIGTLFTLFVLPTMYMYIARDRQPKPAELPAQ